MKKLLILAFAILVPAGLIMALTIFNRKWWIKRIVTKWAMTIDQATGTVMSERDGYQMEYLLKLPFRRLKELYDTGTLK